MYAPAITATGSGLFMALINILPTWVVLRRPRPDPGPGRRRPHGRPSATEVAAMIQLPRRSVTRFFIPLIDVLILLFCIFLLMPIVEATGECRPADRPSGPPTSWPPRPPGAGGLRRRHDDLARRRLRRQEREELERHPPGEDRDAAAAAGDPRAGDRRRHGPAVLLRPGPAREIPARPTARELIERQKRGWPGGRRELYFLILYPRKLTAASRPERQVQAYDRWFKDVPHGFDNPAGGSVTA